MGELSYAETICAYIKQQGLAGGKVNTQFIELIVGAERIRSMIHPRSCTDPTCEWCSMRDCPYQSMIHYSKSGCTECGEIFTKKIELD